jgi:hypothetical protein
MFPGFIEEMFEDRVHVKLDVMYKVLDKNDQDYQGLYKRTETIYIDKKGMAVLLRQKSEPGDIFLVEMFFEEDCSLIKACCEVSSAEVIKGNVWVVKLDFIIIKDSYKNSWEKFLFRQMELAI